MASFCQNCADGNFLIPNTETCTHSATHCFENTKQNFRKCKIWQAIVTEAFSGYESL